MRICMVCPSYPPREVPCGVGDYTRCLVEEMARQGEEVVVVCSPGYRGPMDRPATVLPAEGGWTLRGALRLLASPEMLRTDILHLQYTPELYRPGAGFRLVPLLARLRRRRPATVITFHTLTGGPAGSGLWALVLLATAHHAISANEEVTSMVRRRAPALARRLTEIPIGTAIPALAADAATRRAGRGLLGISPAIPLLAHFGMVYPGKGLETLFEALAIVVREHPGARLAIVGETRPQEAEYLSGLEALAARLGIASAVIWAGPRPGEEVSRILRGADLYVVPYDQGVSIRRSTLMVGMAHGLPIISTRSTLPSAYLRDGENVALVSPRDPRALAERIIALLGAPEEAARLGKGALALAERFSWPGIARETRALYARIVRP